VGLRSVGITVIDQLIKKVQAKLFAELYSTHFSVIFDTKPSYAPDPDFPGEAGIKVRSTIVELPKIQFYYMTTPTLIVTRGYNADFKGQYEVAEKVVAFYEEMKVKRIIVLAGYGTEGKEVCCAATDPKIVAEMKEQYGLEPGYEGPFYGFSGLIFGLAKAKGIEGLCLFGRTEPDLDDPEYPDEQTAAKLLKQLSIIVGLP